MWRRAKPPRWLWAIHVTVGVVTLFAGLSCVGVFPDDGSLKFLSFAEKWFVMEPQIEPSIAEPLPPSTAAPPVAEQSATQAPTSEADERSEVREDVAAEPKARASTPAKARAKAAARKAEAEAGPSVLATMSTPTKHARSARAPKRSKTATTSRRAPKRDSEMEAAAELLVKALGERTLEKPPALE